MPPKKGRKRRPRDRRHAEAGETDVAAPEPPAARDEAARPTTSDLPKLRARMAGFVLAVITMFFGIVNVKVGLGDGSVPTLVIGLLLIVLSLVLGVLSLAPRWVRGLLTRA